MRTIACRGHCTLVEFYIKKLEDLHNGKLGIDSLGRATSHAGVEMVGAGEGWPASAVEWICSRLARGCSGLLSSQ